MSGTLATKTFKSPAAGGVEQRYKSADMNVAEDIVNARVDTVGGGWLFDRGIEPWWNPRTQLTPGLSVSDFTAYFVDPIDALYVWVRGGGEQVYHLIESGGRLYYWLGNKGTTAVASFYDDLVLLQSGRHIRKVNEPGTQFISYGNRLLIINGYDKPLWFYGNSKIRNWGFSLNTPAPEVLDIQPGYLAGTDDLQDSTAAPHFNSSSTIGMGDPSNGKVNTYDYKMTFISDTGSESPLSTPNGLSWEATSSAATQQRFGIVIKHFPTGPAGGGIVARRLYRTRNQKVPELSGADAQYYLVKQVNDNVTDFIIDIVPDAELVDTAPSITDTSTISTGWSFGATWNGSIWLAGGSRNPTKIIYSKQGLPEQFGAFDYFDVGNTAGGAITAIAPYYNNIIVFRQRSIDIVRVGNGGNYQVSQLTPELGTTATNTVKLVPGVGLMFMSYDGIYAIGGGLDGGSSISVQKMSTGLVKETARFSKTYLPRATATYSAKEREYWLHYTPVGRTYNTRGIVYHTEGDVWSFRRDLNAETDWKFGFTALATDATGNILIGTQPRWFGTPTTEGSVGYLSGLHVWSGSTSWGKSLTSAAPTQTSNVWNTADVTLPRNRYESGWFDFADASMKHRVFSVEADVIAFGDIDIELTWSFDYGSTVRTAGNQKQAKSEVLNTTGADPMLGPIVSPSKSAFVVGTSALQEPRMIRLRWDVNTQLVETFRFRLESSGVPFHLLSYDINFDSRNQQALNQRVNLAKGQP